MNTPKVNIVLVLWDVLANKGNKVTTWDSIEDAMDYVERLYPGLKTRVYNGQLHWELGYRELATARTEIVIQN